jgi:hypothetical protein
VRRAPWGRCWSSGVGGGVVCVRNIFILNDIWAQDKIYILVGTLLGWNIFLHLVPVLAPNYKQQILSQAKVRRVCYSLAELYVKSVYLIISCRGGRELHETFKGRAVKVWEPRLWEERVWPQIVWKWRERRKCEKKEPGCEGILLRSLSKSRQLKYTLVIMWVCETHCTSVNCSVSTAVMKGGNIRMEKITQRLYNIKEVSGECWIGFIWLRIGIGDELSEDTKIIFIDWNQFTFFCFFFS